LKIGSEGTVLHVPKTAFVDEAGKTVTSTVTIEYQEFKDAADMAFSQIPMTYTEDGIEYNFNSSGMFYIKGYSNGEEVQINPSAPLHIDYALAKQNVDIDFYRLKNDSSNWDLVQEIAEKLIIDDSIRVERPTSNIVVMPEPISSIRIHIPLMT